MEWKAYRLSFEIISKTGGWHMFGGKKAKELEEEIGNLGYEEKEGN